MHNFKNILYMELRKAFCNHLFIIALMFGIILSIISGISAVTNYFSTREMLNFIGGNPMIEAFGLYNSWLGGESNSLGFTLFYVFFSFIAVLPYGWSYQAEECNGYSKYVSVKIGRKKYLLAKYIAAFLSGGTVVLIPLILNFIGVACFVPAVQPSIVYEMYYAMRQGAIWSDIFYTHPLVFVCLYLLIDFIYGGLFAVIGIAVSLFSKKRLVVVLTPFLITMSMQYVRSFLIPIVHKEVAPIYFLHTTTIQNVADGKIVMAEGLIILIVTLAIVLWKGSKWEDLQ